MTNFFDESIPEIDFSNVARSLRMLSSHEYGIVAMQAPGLMENVFQNDWDLIVLQCEVQGATSQEEILAFGEAYALTKRLCAAYAHRDTPFKTARDLIDFVKHLGRTVDLDKNFKGYRVVPVVINGGSSQPLPPTLIERAMENWAEAVVGGLDPIALYKEFETIHPFIDGNGRVGHLLWAMYTFYDTSYWPYELPPDVFSN